MEPFDAPDRVDQGMEGTVPADRLRQVRRDLAVPVERHCREVDLVGLVLGLVDGRLHRQGLGDLLGALAFEVAVEQCADDPVGVLGSHAQAEPGEEPVRLAGVGRAVEPAELVAGIFPDLVLEDDDVVGGHRGVAVLGGKEARDSAPDLDYGEGPALPCGGGK